MRVRIKPRRTKSRVRLTAPSRKKLDAGPESGPAFDGHRGAPLRKGTQVLRMRGRMPGVIKGIGPEQCEVLWANGVSQAEINRYLIRR